MKTTPQYQEQSHNGYGNKKSNMKTYQDKLKSRNRINVLNRLRPGGPPRGGGAPYGLPRLLCLLGQRKDTEDKTLHIEIIPDSNQSKDHHRDHTDNNGKEKNAEDRADQGDTPENQEEHKLIRDPGGTEL